MDFPFKYLGPQDALAEIERLQRTLEQQALQNYVAVVAGVKVESTWEDLIRQRDTMDKHRDELQADLDARNVAATNALVAEFAAKSK